MRWSPLHLSRHYGRQGPAWHQGDGLTLSPPQCLSPTLTLTVGGKGPHGIKGVGVFEGKIRVPIALQWPAVLAARPPFTHPVISLDLMATMAVRCTSAIHVCIRCVASSTADLSINYQLS